MLALTARALYTPLQRIDQPLALIDGGVIVSVGSLKDSSPPANAKIVDFGDGILAPGLVDIHIHGAAGFDVMQADSAGQDRIKKFLVSRGVTSFYPTTVTAPVEITLRALERLADEVESAEKKDGGRARPLGIHLEGPFLSHARRGVHPPKDLLKPSVGTFERLWQAARGHVRVMTIAPELEDAAELIREASRRGVCVSIGHSDADLSAARAAVAAGARHATHTFNAMRPLDHREPGILGEVLSNSSLTADLIADGIHVHPAIVKLFLEAKGVDGAVLITDATSATGMPDGRYFLGSFEVEVKDGKCTYEGRLAGSVLTLDRAVRNTMKYGNWDLQQALRAATLNPARVVGATKKGVIEPGADADFVILSAEGEVKATVVNGAVVS